MTYITLVPNNSSILLATYDAKIYKNIIFMSDTTLYQIDLNFFSEK